MFLHWRSLILLFLAGPADQLPPVEVRTDLRTAQQIIARHGEALWPGLASVRLRIQLVEGPRETLFCSAPSPGFTAAGTDPVTGCSLQVRGRTLPEDISAAGFLDDQPVIQLGLPQALGSTRSEWVVTALHEGFHQYQGSEPRYQQAVDRLARQIGATGTDWMLNYPFPYGDPLAGRAFARMNRHAAVFLKARTRQAAWRAIRQYVLARRAAAQLVGQPAWSYYEFQAGQEGVAKWTELRLARAAGTSDPGIASIAADHWAGLFTSLRAIDSQGLGVWRRGSFYILGAVEAEMLDRISPGWQRSYLADPFGTGARLDRAVARPLGRQASSP